MVLLLSGCGSERSGHVSGGQNAVVGGSSGYSPYQTRNAALSCLNSAGVSGRPVGRAVIALEGGAYIEFAADRGSSAALQVRGKAEGAELIGLALFFIGAAKEDVIARVERCL